MTTTKATQQIFAGRTLAASVCVHYGKLLHRYLLRRLRNALTAKDLEQEVYLRLLRVGTGDLVRDPQAYMYRIASNVVYEYQQREYKQNVVFDSQMVTNWDKTASESGDPMAEQLDNRRRLKVALERVPARWRAAFIMHTRDGMTYPEIAAALKIAVPTVKKYVTGSFMALREDIRTTKTSLDGT